MRTLSIALFSGILALILCYPSPNWLLRRSLKESVVYVIKDSGATSGGTGFALRNDRGEEYIVTNSHVCRHTQNEDGSVLIQLENKAQIVSHVISIAKNTDLCLIEMVPGVSALSLGSDYSLDDHVYVMGHPYLKPDTFVEGDIINKDTIDIMDHVMAPGEKDEQCSGRVEEVSMFFLKVKACVLSYEALGTTVQIFPGNSGSPMVNRWGNVIGVMFAGDTATNWGYAIPLQNLREYINHPLENK